MDEVLAYDIVGKDGTQRYFLSCNHLYSPAALSDATGVIVERMTYDAYGRQHIGAAAGTVLTKSAVGFDRGFTGYVADNETGLVCARSRMYSPDQGRFLGRDRLIYIDGQSMYQTYFIPNGLDPLGSKKISFQELWDLFDVGQYPLPENATEWRRKARTYISKEAVICQMMQESSFDTEAKSPLGYYGLGQLGEAACSDIDKAYGLPPGTAWKNQLSNDAGLQMANTIAYLHHILVNPNDFGLTKGSLRDALKRYGPKDAGYDEYADPILQCAECLKKATNAITKNCPDEAANSCFSTMQKAVQEARAKVGKKR